ncbi:MAG: hypothetical protein ACRD5K_04685 [Candidatus Acidiferrales bacterium]
MKKVVPRSFGRLVGALLLFLAGASVQANQSPATMTKQKAPNSGRTIRLKAFVAKYDLSHLWTTTNSSEIFGFIGAGYQRLQIHYLSVRKDRNDPAVYFVEGKSLVRNRVRVFKGTIVVESAVEFPARDDCEADIKGLTEGVISGRYLFKENPKQDAAGVFKGKLTTDFYTDKHGVIHYDDILSCSDRYSNNEFVGAWKSYRGTVAEKCNWGDYRAPRSGDLDVGAGEFAPNTKYKKNGWQTWEAEYEQMEREGEKTGYESMPKDKAWWK